jgi:hypothetical protein
MLNIINSFNIVVNKFKYNKKKLWMLIEME